MLGQIIIDNQNILALLHPLFADRTASIRRNILQRRGLRRTRIHDHRIAHRIIFLQLLHQTCNRGFLLADGNINAVDILALLIDDRINRNCRLAGFPISDDQLTLTFADRNHRVNDLKASHQRLINRTSCHDSRSNPLNRASLLRMDFSLVINRLSEGIHHPAQHRISDRHLNNAAGTSHFITFTDSYITAKQYGTDMIFFEVHDHTHDAMRELQKF